MNLLDFLISNKLKKLKRAIAFMFVVVFALPVFSQQDDHIHSSLLSAKGETKYQVNYISLVGNKRTKTNIITRELTFAAGDSLNLKEVEKLIARSQQNLLNSSLFNFATITYQLNEDFGQINFTIDIKERWYTWPTPIFEIQDRNFNSWWETKDIFRTNYGMYLTFQNVRGRNESAILKFRKGYTELYGFNYHIPFINKKQTLGVNAGYSFQRNNEVAYLTYGNKLQFNRNYNQFMRKEIEAKFGFIYRNGLYTKHLLDLVYNESSVANDISKLNCDYFGNKQHYANYISIQYRFKRDYRDSKFFPLRGSYYECLVAKDGLNLLKNENVDNFTVDAVVKNYWSPLKRTFVGTALRFRYKLINTGGYYFNRALGYHDFVRGYEYYVVDGQTYAMFKTNVSYQLVKPRVVKLPTKRFEKFNQIPYSIYASAHADAAFVQDKVFYNDNPLSNSWLGGAGIGLSFVTYYDYVLRVEASMNRMKEKGIFLHFSAPL